MISQDHARVVLFGSIQGGWREQFIIPVLDELGITYYHPGTPNQTWTEEMGPREAEALEHAETIVMVINDTSPAFGSLSETGWAALGAAQRRQTFLLYVQQEFVWRALPGWLRWTPGARHVIVAVEEYARRARVLVREHAVRFAGEVEHLVVVDSLDDLAQELRRIYGKQA